MSSPLAELANLALRLMGGESGRRTLSTAVQPWHRRILLALVLVAVALLTLGGSVVGYSTQQFLCDELGWLCQASSAWEPTEQIPERGFTSVSSGDGFTCAIRASDRLTCWTTSGSRVPTPTGRFKAVSAGHNHYCAIRTNGQLECRMDRGETFQQTPDGRFSVVEVGEYHNCALQENDTAVCWSWHTNISDDSPIHDLTNAPSGRYVALSVGVLRACAVRSESLRIVCWGWGSWGWGSWSPRGQYKTVSVHDEVCAIRDDGYAVCWDPQDLTEYTVSLHFLAISVGDGHVCGILATGAPDCWGYDEDAHTRTLTHLSFSTNTQYDSISVGYSHACAIRRDNGAIACSAGGDHVQKGVFPGHFTYVDATADHVCALSLAGNVTCWGRNDYGQADAPQGQFVSVSAGGYHSCAVRAVSGQLVCWGDNELGQSEEAPPGRFSAVSAGYLHSCALRLDGRVECWGANSHGESNAPATLYVAVDAGADQSCAINAIDPGVECWGHTSSNAPEGWRRVLEGRFTSVSAGWANGCALRWDRAAVCWSAEQSTAEGNVFDGVYQHIDYDMNSYILELCATTTLGVVECSTTPTKVSQYGWREGKSALATQAMRMATTGNGYVCGVRQHDGAVVCEGGDALENPSFFVVALLAKKPELPTRRRLGRVRARRLNGGRVQLGFWFVAEGEPAVLTNGTLKQKRSGEDDWQYVGPVVRGDERWGHIRARWADSGWLELGFVLLTTEKPDVGTVWEGRLPMPLSGDVDGWAQDDDGWYRGEEIALDVGDVDRVVPGPLRPHAVGVSRDQSPSGWRNAVRGLLRLRNRPTRHDARLRAGVWAQRRKGRQRKRGQ